MDDDLDEIVDERVRTFDQFAHHPDFIGGQLEKVERYLVEQEALAVEDQFPQVRILRYHLDCLVRELSIEQPNPAKAVSHAFALGRLFLIEDYRELHKSAEGRAAGRKGGSRSVYTEADVQGWAELWNHDQREGNPQHGRITRIRHVLKEKGANPLPSTKTLSKALAYLKTV